MTHSLDNPNRLEYILEKIEKDELTPLQRQERELSKKLVSFLQEKNAWPKGMKYEPNAADAESVARPGTYR